MSFMLSPYLKALHFLLPTTSYFSKKSFLSAYLQVSEIHKNRYFTFFFIFVSLQRNL